MRVPGFLGMEGFARRRSRRFDTTEDMDSALKVIELIPRNQDQDAVWHSLEGSLCEHEDVADMKTLGRFKARLPHDLAKAIDLDNVSNSEQSAADRQVETASISRQGAESIDGRESS
jgi:hypothetical protein